MSTTKAKTQIAAKKRVAMAKTMQSPTEVKPATAAPNIEAKLNNEALELRERFLFLVDSWAADKYRYQWLENHTGIPAARWQNVLLEKQLPTLEMLIAICKNREEHTHWLIHGTQKLFVNEKKNSLPFRLLSPDEEILAKYKSDREWIKERKLANANRG